MSQHVISVRTNLIVFAILMLLLVLTVGVAYINLGVMGLPVAMAIATVKAVLIVLYFMHVRWSTPITWVFAGSAFFWLAIMIFLTLNDYLTRGFLYIDGK
jgi:cytochrome c oxidase subunit IV